MSASMGFAAGFLLFFIAVVFQPPLVSAANCYINSGFDYSSGANDMLQRAPIDIGACCNLCTSTPGCKAFVWNPADRKCYLKSGYGSTTPAATLYYGFPDNTTTTPVGSPCCSQRCPPGWKGPTTTQKCYQVPAQSGTPVTGNQICGATPGAQLGSIKSQDESDFVKSNLLQDAGGDWLVTGGRYNGNSWYWTDSSSGSPLVYSDFGNPNGQSASPPGSNVFLYLYPSTAGVNAGKFWADQSVSHRLLCELSLPKWCGCGGCGNGGSGSCGC